MGAELVVYGVGLWFYVYPSSILPNIHTLIFSIGTVIVPGGVMLKFFEQQSPFEQSLLAELQEINILLRKRGTE